MEIKEFIKHMTFLSLSFNKKVEEDVYRVWYEMFKDVDSQTLAMAIKDVVRTSKFFPTIAELLECCGSQHGKHQLAIIQKMIDAGYFKDPREIDKTYHFISNGTIPGWLLEDMKKYGYQDNKPTIGLSDDKRLLTS